MVAVSEPYGPLLVPTGRRRVRLVVGALVAVLMIYLLSRVVDWQTAASYLRQAHPAWVAAGVVSVFINGIAKTLRWRVLFPPLYPLPRRRTLFGIVMAGQLLNLMLPLRSGDVSRAYFVGRDQGASSAAAAGAIGAEKLIDLIIMAGAAALVLGFVALPGWVQTGGWGLLVVAIIAAIIWGIAIVALPLAQRWLASLGRRFPLLSAPSATFARLLEGFTTLRQWHRLPALLGWTAVTWTTGIATNLFLMRALDLPTSLLSAVLVLIVIFGGISVPVAPAHIGVFEGLAVVALALIGIPSDAALAFGVLLHLVVLSAPLVVGLPWLWRRMSKS